MKQITTFINEKFCIDKNTVSHKLDINVDVDKLSYFKQKDIDKIIDWIENNMPDKICPNVIMNNIGDWDEEYALFLFWDDNIDPKFSTYIRFYYDEDGLSVNIYNAKNQIYYNSANYKDIKDLDKCFEFIESKYDILKKII